MPTFSAPSAGGDRCKPAEVNGHLLLVKPLRWEEDITWAEGESGIVCDIVDLNDGTVYNESTWTQKKLRASLRNQVGNLVLAWMVQGEKQPGKNAPWELRAAHQDQAAVAAAEQWLGANPSFEKAQPTPPVTAFKPQTTAPQAPAYQPTGTDF